MVKEGVNVVKIISGAGGEMLFIEVEERTASAGALDKPCLE